jgi:4-amino-4-deoxy-L-arabinose transferase-like glycosyltransferase
LVLALPWLVPAWRRQLQKRDGRVLVLLGWVTLVVLFFCISAGKRKLYIYPALPGLVLAAAPLIPGCCNAGSSGGRACAGHFRPWWQAGSCVVRPWVYRADHGRRQPEPSWPKPRQ